MKKKFSLISVFTLLVVIITFSIGDTKSVSNGNTNWLVRPQYDNALPFSEGFAAVNKGARLKKYAIGYILEGGKWGYINSEGKVVINLQFEDARIFSDGLAAVKINNKWGYIDKEAGFVIKPKFDAALDFKDGVARVKEGDCWGCIDKNGSYLISPQFYWIEAFFEGIAIVHDIWNKHQGYINKTGDIIIPLIYSIRDHLRACKDGMIIVEVKEQGIFIYNDSGKLIYGPGGNKRSKFSKTTFFSEGLAGVENSYVYYNYNSDIGFKWGFINKEGKVVIDTVYDEVRSFSEGLAAVKKMWKWGFINKEGQLVIDCQFDRVGSFSEGIASVQSNGKWGAINKEGKLIIDYLYNDDSMNSFTFHDGVAQVSQKGQIMLINKEGKIMIKGYSEQNIDFSEGLASFIRNGKIGLIDLSGNFVLKPEFSSKYNDRIVFSEGYALVWKDTKAGYIKNPLNSEVQVQFLEQTGQFIGEVKSISAIEIIVAGSNIAEKVRMGDKLCIILDNEIIIFNASFPMQTVTKCKVIAGNRDKIKLGMKVFKYKHIPPLNKEK
jgi:hypothetical protein